MTRRRTSAAKKRIVTGVVLGVVSICCLVFALTGAPQAPQPDAQEPSTSVVSSATAQDPSTSTALPGEGGSQSGANANPSASAGTATEPQQGNAAHADADPATDASSSTVRISILVDSSAAQSLGYPAAMATGTMELPTGSSAYDALVATGLSLSGSPSYVSAVNGLAEKVMGGSSGWTYTVNGTMPMTGASSYVLSSGDSLVWRYVT